MSTPVDTTSNGRRRVCRRSATWQTSSKYSATDDWPISGPLGWRLAILPLHASLGRVEAQTRVGPASPLRVSWFSRSSTHTPSTGPLPPRDNIRDPQQGVALKRSSPSDPRALASAQGLRDDNDQTSSTLIGLTSAAWPRKRAAICPSLCPMADERMSACAIVAYRAVLSTSARHGLGESLPDTSAPDCRGRGREREEEEQRSTVMH